MRSGTLSRLPRLLILPLCMAGCASTRTVPSQIKTVASIGDKPLPVVTGEPGAIVQADREEPALSRNNDGRISGRVLDEQGEPIPNARVRLAASSAAGGKVVRTTSDRTGAFTLRGMKPGGSYTVIAEYDDDNGTRTGRSVVDAPESDAEISLGPVDGDAPTTRKASASRRISTASSRGGDDEDTDEKTADLTAPLKLNEEDLPPAPEAESLDDDGEPRRTASMDKRKTAPRPAGGGWRPLNTGKSTATAKDPEPADEPADSNPPRTSSKPRASQKVPIDDDGPNPLPPAKEPGHTSFIQNELGAESVFEETPAAPAGAVASSAEPAPAKSDAESRGLAEMGIAPVPGAVLSAPLPERVASAPAPVQRARPGPNLGVLALAPIATAPVAVANVFEDHVAAPVGPANVFENTEPLASSNPFGDPVSPAESAINVFEEPAQPAPARPAEEKVVEQPSAVVAASAAVETPAPVLETLPPALETLPPAAVAVESPAPAAVAVETLAPAAVAVETPAPELAIVPAEDNRKRPSWKEMALAAQGTPFERESQPAPRPHASVRMVENKPVRKVSHSTVSDPPRDDGKPFCDFDLRHRRIRDFLLPDLEGRPVRLKDIDADLVLIDFWGTWCNPCIKSVPHLIDLQKRYGGQKLQVVGIACEQGTEKENARTVATKAKKLGINYPVLVSTMDGRCPVQKALQVNVFPTMILVDREGRILWRDQGSTPMTLARLDRLLNAPTQSDQVRRY